IAVVDSAERQNRVRRKRIVGRTHEMVLQVDGTTGQVGMSANVGAVVAVIEPKTAELDVQVLIDDLADTETAAPAGERLAVAARLHEEAERRQVEPVVQPLI